MIEFDIDHAKSCAKLINESKYKEAISKLDILKTWIDRYQNYKYIDFYLDYKGKNIIL